VVLRGLNTGVTPAGTACRSAGTGESCSTAERNAAFLAITSDRVSSERPPGSLDNRFQ
jgi:hypothetical protein